MRFISRILLSLALLVAAISAFAGETGSISGVVKDGTGAPVPGATVKITGAQAPRDTLTGSSGAFKFVRNAKTGPSMSMKLYSASALSSSSATLEFGSTRFL